jgi:mannose-6-phosphate isomerase-like protein (cupin superfamily)
MKIIRKNEAMEFKNSDTCTVFEYKVGRKDIDGAVALIAGRYPSKGVAVNEVSRELAYIIEGNGKVVIDGKEFALDQDDLVCIDPQEKFYWEGKMKLFMPCAPAWTPDQYRIID